MKLLNLPGFDRLKGCNDVKVLRHKDTKLDLWSLRRRGKFQRYQDGQSRDVFGTAQYVISFIAERNEFAKFVGVWEVLSKKRSAKGGYRYRTRELPGFADLEGRLIVRWGEGTRSWAQRLDRKGDKEVFELLPPNYVADFPGYYDFTLSYDELHAMVAKPESNREWQRMLSSVSGVYVVLDTHSGKQYIGSAYGSGGIWARWRGYARSASGGNLLLKQLIGASVSRHRHFRFSILRVLESAARKEDVIAHECLIKEKLGSRAFGLNSN
jgi:hypothetical protein